LLFWTGEGGEWRKNFSNFNDSGPEIPNNRIFRKF